MSLCLYNEQLSKCLFTLNACESFTSTSSVTRVNAFTELKWPSIYGIYNILKEYNYIYFEHFLVSKHIVSIEERMY